MAQNRRVSVVADSDSRQITKVPNKRPGPPFIYLTNVEMEMENGKKEKIDLNITLSVDLFGYIVRDGINELKALQESAQVKVG